jgi:hypothetical protein
MTRCGCKWDGNLDGKLLRCQTHARIAKAERLARRQADSLYRKLIQESRDG